MDAKSFKALQREHRAKVTNQIRECVCVYERERESVKVKGRIDVNGWL